MPIRRIQDLKFKYRDKVKGSDGVVRELVTNSYFVYKTYRKLKNGYSILINICGAQRVGKSLIGVYFAILFMELFGKKFDPVKNTFYDPIKVLEGIKDDDRQVIIIDEAGDILHSREWYDKTHKALSGIINTQGFKSNVYIFISPFTVDIDKTFIKHFDFQIRVDDRGKFKCFQFFKKYDEMDSKKVSRRKFLDQMTIKIGNVDKDIWEVYVKHSLEQKELLRQKQIIKAQPKVKEDNFMKLANEIKNSVRNLYG